MALCKKAFPELAVLISSDSKSMGSFSGRAPHPRSAASARSALGFAHELKWKSPAKEKAQARELAPNFLSTFRIANAEG